MKTLTLPLKKQWFDMIKSGEKKEEYRAFNEYWQKRLYESNDITSNKWHLTRSFDKLVFNLGYPKVDDTERRLEFKKAIVVLFGEGGIGIGLGNEKPELNIHLQELKKLKKVREFLTNEEIMDNFKNPKNPNEVVLHFPTEESMNNFIETLNIYKDAFFKK